MSEFSLNGLGSYSTEQLWDEIKSRIDAGFLLCIVNERGESLRHMYSIGSWTTLIGCTELVKHELLRKALDSDDAQTLE